MRQHLSETNSVSCGKPLLDEIGLHKNTILYHLNILVKKGKIKRKGKGKNAFYVIRTE